MNLLRTWARALGGDVVGSQILCPGPGHGPRDRSLSVRISATAPEGFLAFSHAGDDFAVCRDYVKGHLGLDPNGWKATDRESRPQPRPQTIANPDDNVERTAAALAIWAASADPRGTLAERYLAGRGLELDDDIAGSVLRWHPGILAMVALFRNIATNEPQAISRTFLNREGRKLERKFLGRVGGAAIKLDLDEEALSGLHIAEGVETAMAGRLLGLKPCWAMGSKGAIASFPILSGVECLTILAEPDAEKETQSCAGRWHSAGCEVLITRAVGGGAKDANDIIMAVRA